MKINLGFDCSLNIYFNRQVKRIGICSQSYLEPEKHMLLCDFDNAMLDNVVDDLMYIQDLYCLPQIHIIQSSPAKYHAYCFCKREFKNIVKMLSDLPSLCDSFYRIGILRGYFTLRISKRKGEQFKKIWTMKSEYLDEMLPSEITTNEFLTANKGKR